MDGRLKLNQKFVNSFRSLSLIFTNRIDFYYPPKSSLLPIICEANFLPKFLLDSFIWKLWDEQMYWNSAALNYELIFHDTRVQTTNDDKSSYLLRLSIYGLLADTQPRFPFWKRSNRANI